MLDLKVGNGASASQIIIKRGLIRLSISTSSLTLLLLLIITSGYLVKPLGTLPETVAKTCSISEIWKLCKSITKVVAKSNSKFWAKWSRKILIWTRPFSQTDKNKLEIWFKTKWKSKIILARGTTFTRTLGQELTSKSSPFTIIKLRRGGMPLSCPKRSWFTIGKMPIICQYR